MILRKRAEEITELIKKMQDEISMLDETIADDISIGAGETDGIRYIARVAKNLQAKYPLIHFHIVSGDKITVLEELDRGLIDFALLFGEIDSSKCEYLELPSTEKFLIAMQESSC